MGGDGGQAPCLGGTALPASRPLLPMIIWSFSGKSPTEMNGI